MVCEGKEAVPMEKTQAAIYCRLSQDDGSLGVPAASRRRRHFSLSTVKNTTWRLWIATAMMVGAALILTLACVSPSRPK